ncbi:hypothetical protein L218DRAFT_653481 [Marasmius fiardii PR-910]|nr:hypothetical protein L218DRAFT_653481 [Marasmius fiardii PR-910]
MLECWKRDPQLRPAAAEVLERVADLESLTAGPAPDWDFSDLSEIRKDVNYPLPDTATLIHLQKKLEFPAACAPMASSAGYDPLPTSCRPLHLTETDTEPPASHILPVAVSPPAPIVGYAARVPVAPPPASIVAAPQAPPPAPRHVNEGWIYSVRADGIGLYGLDTSDQETMNGTARALIELTRRANHVSQRVRGRANGTNGILMTRRTESEARMFFDAWHEDPPTRYSSCSVSLCF